jgi:hypothetical protein
VYQAVYQAPNAGAPAVRRPSLITSSDLVGALRDGLIPLAAVLVGTFAAVVALAYLASSQDHGGFHDWFTSTVILVAGAFGAQTNLSYGLGDSSTVSNGFSFGVDLSISITAWIITLGLLWMLARRAGRSETLVPSGSPAQTVARSALPAVAVGLVLFILALVSSTSDLFRIGDNVFGTGSGGSGGTGSGTDLGGLGGTGFSGSSGASVHSSISVAPGWVLLGPLLLAAAACLIGRLGAVARRPEGDPGGEWIRKLTAPWRAAAATVWTQLRAVAVLAGLTLVVYLAYRVATDSAPGREKATAALLVLLLIPNLAVGGMLAGFCVTLFAGADLGGALGLRGQEIGLFGNNRPWLIYVLILAAVLGTALPWLLVRRGRRRVIVEAFAPGQAWRAALLGAVATLFVALLGQASLSGGLGPFVGGASVGLTFSTIGAVLAGAIWYAAGYLAVAYQVRPRVSAEPVAAPPPAYPYSWPTPQQGVGEAPAPEGP